jgi:hypothetical protein
LDGRRTGAGVKTIEDPPTRPFPLEPVELAPVWLLIWWRVVDAEVKRIKLMNRY